MRSLLDYMADMEVAKRSLYAAIEDEDAARAARCLADFNSITDALATVVEERYGKNGTLVSAMTPVSQRNLRVAHGLLRDSGAVIGLYNETFGAPFAP